MTAYGDLDQARIRELHIWEVARFWEARPRSRAMIARAREHMPNGVPMVWMAFHNDQLVYIDHGEGPGFTDAITQYARRYADQVRRWERDRAEADQAGE